MYKKGLVVAVIFLFVAVSFQPIIAENTISVDKETDYNNVDFEQAKEYLFQTLIDISNNPEVKEFLNELKHDLITRNNNFDCKNAIQKIYSQNPKLLKSILFTKPKMTIEYLEKNYNRGLEIVDILGEEESLKLVSSIKANQYWFYELKNIITNDEEIFNRVSVLKEMNDNIISNLDFFDYPIICNILVLIYSSFYGFYDNLANLFIICKSLILRLLILPWLLMTDLTMGFIFILLLFFNCLEFPSPNL